MRVSRRAEFASQSQIAQFTPTIESGPNSNFHKFRLDLAARPVAPPARGRSSGRSTRAQVDESRVGGAGRKPSNDSRPVGQCSSVRVSECPSLQVEHSKREKWISRRNAIWPEITGPNGRISISISIIQPRMGRTHDKRATSTSTSTSGNKPENSD